MAHRYASQIFSKINTVRIMGQREFFIDARSFATRQKAKKKSKNQKCPNKTCKKYTEEKRSIWSLFRSKPQPPKRKPPLESCRKHIAESLKKPDPDLSSVGGTPYRTCGTAYIVQKEVVPKEEIPVEPEDRILQKIEAHPALKNVVDPMPPFESVEQRLIALCDKKLHPFYKLYMSIPPKEYPPANYLSVTYSSRSGPISQEEIPHHLQLNKDCLDKKNIYHEFKKSEPPRQLLAKMVEIKRNKRPTMEKKKEKAQAPTKPFDMRRALNESKNSE